MIDPFAIGSLPSGELLAHVELRGRVIAAQGSQLVVADETAAARVELRPGMDAPPLGAWVCIQGRWSGERLHARTLAVAALPAREFGAADSEWARAQPDRLVALRIRHALLRLVRQFFDEQGFTEVETPAMVESPGLELHLDALEVRGESARRYLHTSPEYHMKRLLSAGMSRIYQCCKVYRRGELGVLHQPEFSMLEWYRSFAGMEEMILDTEALVFFVVSSLRGGRTSIPVRTKTPWELDLTPPWERLSVREAFERYADRTLDQVLPDESLFHRVLSEQIEPQLGQTHPTILTHYPAAMASLARLSPEDPSVAERFEVYVRGIELCNGFGELTDAAEQRARLASDLRARRERQRPLYPIDERFLSALADGIPPSGGNALGLDRLVMLALGAQSVDEVVAFPARRD